MGAGTKAARTWRRGQGLGEKEDVPVLSELGLL